MANVFSKSLGDLGKWLQTEEGRRLGASAIGAPGTPLASSDIVRPQVVVQQPAAQAQYLTPAQGRLLQAGEPAPTPAVPTRGLFGTVPRPMPPNPYQTISSEGMPYTPGGQSGMAVSPSPVWNPNAPSPLQPATTPAPQAQPSGQSQPASDYDRMYRMPAQTGTGAAFSPQPFVTDRVPAAVPWEEQPTGQVTGAPSGPFPGPPTSITPTGQVTGGPTGSFPVGRSAAAGPAPATSPTGQPVVMPTESGNVPMPPTKVTHTVESPTHTTKVTSQLKQPGGGAASTGGAGATAASGAPSATRGPAGPAPAVGGGGQDADMQISHPGLLERIGQTISHFFGGTLGQHPTVGQYAAGASQPGAGQTINLGQLPENSAVSSGIARALASGRQHIAQRGGSAPASAAAPPQPITMQPTGYVSGVGTAAGGPESGQMQPPLSDTDIYTDAQGRRYRYDVTNPGRRTLIG